MALDIKDLKLEGTTGLLSKIQIGGNVYTLKDLIARENIETVAGLVDTLSAKVDVLEKSGYDDTEVRNLIAALQAADEAFDAAKADKTQVAADIKAAVDAEAAIARAAEKANADEIARVDAALAAAIENDGEGLDSIKELATWIETHGSEATAMSAAITKNAEDIAAMDTAYKAADEAIDGRLDVIETALGDGEGSVSDQIADAKAAAVADAKNYTDGEINKLGDLAKKNEADLDLKALAHKDSASGTVTGQTISGVKATGTSTGSINVALTEGEAKIASTGSYTPAGFVDGGKVTAAGEVKITITNADAQASLTTADYQPAGDVSVVLSNNEINAVKSVGTQASFTEGTFTPAALDHADVTANYVEEGLVGAVENETLTFTSAAVKALSASKVNSFSGGSKAADTFVANELPVAEVKTVGVQSATFEGDVAAGLKVTGVTYQTHDVASATFTGSEVAVTGASFSGDAATIEVSGNGKTYAVDAANTKFNGAEIELAVGDIVVAAKDVTVS